MKKFIIFSLFAVMIAGMAFAADGITINAWGRGAFSPLVVVGAPKEYGDTMKGNASVDANGDPDSPYNWGYWWVDKDLGSRAYAGTGVTWGGPLPRVDFRIVGATEHVGFAVASTGEVGAGLGGADDAAHLWAKPFGSDILKLTVGKFVDDTLRGKVGSVNGGFECFTLWGYGNNEEDPIFNRFSSYGSTWGSAPGGFMLSSAPVDGLFFGLMVNGAMWNWGGPGTYLRDAYRYMQIGAGYEIENIGHIRAQYIGGFAGTLDDSKFEKRWGENDDDDPYFWSEYDDDGNPTANAYEIYRLARIEFAFALTAVENLTVDLGAKIWMPLEYKDFRKVSNGIDVSVGANFDSDAFGITGRVDAKGLGAYVHNVAPNVDDKSGKGMEIDVRLVPYYKIDDVSIGLDLGMIAWGKDKAGNGDKVEASGGMVFGFGGWVSKALAGGYVKAGLTFTTAEIRRLGKATENAVEKSGATGNSVFSIPIVLEYAFF